MELKRIILRCIIIVIGVIVLGSVLIRFVPIPQNAELPMWFLTARLNGVVRDYGKLTSTVKYEETELDWCINATNENKKNLSDLSENQGVLHINFIGRPQNYGNPIEIYAMFECFLVLHGKTIPKDIVAITCSSRSGEWNDANSTLITVTVNEFEALYESFAEQIVL